MVVPGLRFPMRLLLIKHYSIGNSLIKYALDQDSMAHINHIHNVAQFIIKLSRVRARGATRPRPTRIYKLPLSNRTAYTMFALQVSSVIFFLFERITLLLIWISRQIGSLKFTEVFCNCYKLPV